LGGEDGRRIPGRRAGGASWPHADEFGAVPRRRGWDRHGGGSKRPPAVAMVERQVLLGVLVVLLNVAVYA
jgi:hypothetical protein